jgi:hypothetical protein
MKKGRQYTVKVRRPSHADKRRLAPGRKVSARASAAEIDARRQNTQEQRRAILLDFCLAGLSWYEAADYHGITAAKATILVTDALRWFAYSADGEIEAAAIAAGVDLNNAGAGALLESWHRPRPRKRPTKPAQG